MAEPNDESVDAIASATKLPDINSCKFNQTGTAILATTPVGFLIYALGRDGNVFLQHEYDVGTEIKLCERLYTTNLVAYATVKNPDVFVVFHCKRKKIVCDFRYPSEINIIRFNRQRVIIAIKDAIYIHNVRNMQILHLIKDTPENPRGIMELACSENCGYLAFPWKATTGAVLIFDVFQLQDIACIQAHQSPLAFVRFNPSGSRIATSSVKGTCIRVYDSSHGQKLYEFRRGFKEVRITSLSFSLDGRFLSATSDSETIHIFKLQSSSETAANGESGGFFKSVKTAGGLISSEERAFVTTASPLHGQNAFGYLGSLGGNIVFLLITPKGLLNVFSLDEGVDGSGSLVPLKQHSLREAGKSTDREDLCNDMEQDQKSFLVPPSQFDKPFEKVQTENKDPAKNSKKSRKSPAPLDVKSVAVETNNK